MKISGSAKSFMTCHFRPSRWRGTQGSARGLHRLSHAKTHDLHAHVFTHTPNVSTPTVYTSCTAACTDDSYLQNKSIRTTRGDPIHVIFQRSNFTFWGFINFLVERFTRTSIFLTQISKERLPPMINPICRHNRSLIRSK